ncbi:MAG: hypothetical protein ACXVPQ_13050 [Bacteroidia bacterium]
MSVFRTITNWFLPNFHQSKVEKPNSAFIGAILLGFVGLVVLIVYAFSIGFVQKQHHWLSTFSVMSVVILIAFASFAVGGVIGFLFGIPRTLQHPDNHRNNGNSEAQSGSDSNYSDNTNLEQISDWLTKIMVGVGLTQIHTIAARFNDLSYSLGASLHEFIPTAQFAPVAGTIIIMFMIDGFIIFYLWTRLFLAKIQDGSLDEKINSKLQDNDLNDKDAISIANNQIYLPVGVDDFPVDKLYDAFKKASGNVVSSIFFKSINIRKTNWSIDKPRMERTIPIFKALIRLDSGLEFPENYAELGYALKDKTEPDYREALNNLSKAIDGFKARGNTQGIAIVYYNCAVCRIELDNEFKQNKPSTDDNYKLIKADIDEANKEEYVKRIVASDIVIKKWTDLNTPAGNQQV